MTHIIPVLLFTISGLAACKDKKQAGVSVDSKQQTEIVAPDPAKDSAAIEAVILDFYTWYNKNYAKLMEFDLYDGIKKKDAPPYKINWDVVEKYQDFIRTSVPQLGEEFLKNQKILFQQCDSAFKVDIEDDLPYGFDYDWYTNSQEDPAYLLEAITRNKSGWDIIVNGNEAVVRISGFNDHRGKQERIHFISLAMKKEKENWTIAKIGID